MGFVFPGVSNNNRVLVGFALVPVLKHWTGVFGCGRGVFGAVKSSKSRHSQKWMFAFDFVSHQPDWMNSALTAFLWGIRKSSVCLSVCLRVALPDWLTTLRPLSSSTLYREDLHVSYLSRNNSRSQWTAARNCCIIDNWPCLILITWAGRMFSVRKPFV